MKKDKIYSKKFVTSSPPIISFAQNGEDIVLNRAFPKLSNGFYVDIGAADPIVNSATNLFYQKGWSGINVEPNTSFFQKLKRSRTKDINLHIGISSQSGQAIFYDCLTNKEWSTFSKKVYLTHKRHQVKFKKTKLAINTLANILDQHKPPKTINFLKVDVEGLEEQVLGGNNWQKYRPIVVVIESNSPQKCHLLMSQNNYLLVLNDGLNLFYLDNKYKNLKKHLDKPANIRDNFIPYLYHHQATEFQKKEKQLHQDFSRQYSLIKKELKKTQDEFQKLHQAYSLQLNKNTPSAPTIKSPIINQTKNTSKINRPMTPSEIRQKIANVKDWYHRFKVAPGITTPGVNNSTKVLKSLNLPKSCKNLRVLDIGTRDGYFAFELEKRGAQVVALDYIPKETTGFAVMAEILNSKNVTYVQDNIFNISAAKYGTFDIVLFLGLLYHLPDPIRALQIVRSVCRDRMYIETQGLENAFLLPNGKLTTLNSVSPLLKDIPIMQFYPKKSLNNDQSNYWAPNLTCLVKMLEETNFQVLSSTVNGNRLLATCQIGHDFETEYFLNIATGNKNPTSQ